MERSSNLYDILGLRKRKEVNVMKRMIRMILAMMIAAMMTVPSFAAMPEEAGMDLPDGWDVQSVMKTGIPAYPMVDCDVLHAEKEGEGSIEVFYMMNTEGTQDREYMTDEDLAMETYWSIVEGSDNVIYEKGNIGEDADYTIRKNDWNEYVIYMKDGCNAVLIAPQGDRFARVFYLEAASEDGLENVMNAACSYEDAGKFQNQIFTEMKETYREEVTDKAKGYEGLGTGKALLVLFGIALIAVIFVVGKAIIRVNMNKKGTREEFDPVKAGQVPVELTCGMCGKKYTKYAYPEEEGKLRENSNRCPECEKNFKEKLNWSAKHIMWWR